MKISTLTACVSDWSQKGSFRRKKKYIICIPHLESAVIIKIAFQLTYFVPVREEEKLILKP